MSDEAGSGANLASPPRKSSARTLWTLLALAAGCYFAIFAFYPALFWYAGINHYGVWFLDTFALLASNDAVTRGLNAYVANPLDYFGRPHVYSHWWLHLRDLGLTRADNFWVGLTLVGAFLVAALSRLRPAEPRQMLYYLAVLCSSPVLLAVNRANNDLVVFVLLTPLVSCLLDGRGVVRLAAPFLIAAAAALKYYPAAAGLVLLAAAPARELRGRVALAAGLFVLVGIGLKADLAAFAPLAPKPEGFLSFGSTAFFHALGWDGWAPKLLCVAGGAAAFGWFWRSRWFDGWEVPAGRRADWLHFVLGASLLAGCFFTSLNFSYRWIFAVWLAPFLWSLPTDSSAPARVRRLAALTRALLIAVLWIDAAACLVLNRFVDVVSVAELKRWAEIGFLLEQPVYWALFLCLLAFLARFTRQGVGDLLAH
jgi:hypothetical protein